MTNKPFLTMSNTEKTATLHWLMQRITAVILIPLTLSVIVFLDHCLNAPYQQTITWLQAPLNRLCLGTWVLIACYHAAIGLQVVIEDYVAKPGLQAMIIKVINLGLVLLAVISMFFMFRSV